MSKKPKGGSPFEVLAELKKRLAAEEAELAAKAKGGAAKGPAPATAPKKTKTKTKPTEAEPSAEDALTFHRMMSNVVPLEPSRVRVPTSWVPESSLAADAAARRQNAKTAAEEEAEAVHEHLRMLVEGGARFEVEDDGVRVQGRRVDLPPDALRRLRRGLLPIDGRLDLHGKGAAEAREALERFLAEKRAKGERCLLVVHGKGNHSSGLGPILRGEIAAWLSQGRGSQHVAAFATATESDGGEGATYVLLRR